MGLGGEGLEWVGWASTHVIRPGPVTGTVRERAELERAGAGRSLSDLLSSAAFAAASVDVNPAHFAVAQRPSHCLICCGRPVVDNSHQQHRLSAIEWTPSYSAPHQRHLLLICSLVSEMLAPSRQFPWCPVFPASHQRPRLLNQYFSS